MDTMALLCNLYGNGPATLRRLRAAGCTSFDGLEGLGTDRLADLLVDSPEGAKRFLREAERLRARVADLGVLTPDLEEARGSWAEEDDDYDSEGDGYEDEDEDYEDEDEEEEEDAEEDDEDYEDEDEDDRFGDEDDEDTFDRADDPTDVRRDVLVTRALGEWRARDAGGAARTAEPTPLGMPERRAERLASAEPPADSGERLVPDLIEGLDSACIGSLADLGVESVESLAEADVDRLAPAMGVRVTRLLRLRYLARSRMASNAGRAPTAPRPRGIGLVFAARPQADAPPPSAGTEPRAADVPRAPAASLEQRVLPAPGPGAAAAVAAEPRATRERFSASERPEAPARGLLEGLWTPHVGPRTWSLRDGPSDSAGPFA